MNTAKKNNMSKESAGLQIQKDDLEKLIIRVTYGDICKVLEEVSAPCCVIKGKPLSVLAYGDVMARKSGDIDLLIGREHIRELEEALVQHGYTAPKLSREDRVLCLSASHQIPPYVKNIIGTRQEIDVNFDLFWGEYTGNRIDMNEFLSDLMEVDILGKKVKTLPPLKAMVQLVLHHYKEMNSIFLLAGHGSFQPKLFRDAYHLWKNNSKEISLVRLRNISEQYGILPYVYYVLYYTNIVHPDEELEHYVEELMTPEGEELLDCYGLTEKERRPWKVDFMTRYNAEDLYPLPQPELTEQDHKKMQLNLRLFGDEKAALYEK